MISHLCHPSLPPAIHRRFVGPLPSVHGYTGASRFQPDGASVPSPAGLPARPNRAARPTVPLLPLLPPRLSLALLPRYTLAQGPLSSWPRLLSAILAPRPSAVAPGGKFSQFWAGVPAGLLGTHCPRPAAALLVHSRCSLRVCEVSPAPARALRVLA